MRSYDLKKQVAWVLTRYNACGGISMTEDEAVLLVCNAIHGHVDAALSERLWDLVQERNPGNEESVVAKLDAYAEARDIVERTMFDWPRHG